VDSNNHYKAFNNKTATTVSIIAVRVLARLFAGFISSGVSISNQARLAWSCISVCFNLFTFENLMSAGYVVRLLKGLDSGRQCSQPPEKVLFGDWLPHSRRFVPPAVPV